MNSKQVTFSVYHYLRNLGNTLVRAKNELIVHQPKVVTVKEKLDSTLHGRCLWSIWMSGKYDMDETEVILQLFRTIQLGFDFYNWQKEFIEGMAIRYLPWGDMKNDPVEKLLDHELDELMWQLCHKISEPQLSELLRKRFKKIEYTDEDVTYLQKLAFKLLV